MEEIPYSNSDVAEAVQNMVTDEFLTKILGLEEPELVWRISQAAEIRQVKKGQILFREGEKPGYVAILVRGIFRCFFLDLEGRDITDCLVWKCGESLMPGSDVQGPAPASTEALSDGEIFCLPVGELMVLLRQYPAVMELYSAFLLRSGEYHMEIKRVIYGYDAMERYQWFLGKYPGLIQMIPNRHVASFLNMTPVTLSRIRKQLREGARREKSAGA
ncbi:MAG TPA: Crp/Fnr family transcriptional regulator [Candidatus Cottocaccamicrobium excrementipullorum]|nr:Crp/Fnr family transcriptional regulator [Candidatus Cottocaccamicrobium excrementipullorum]